MFIELSNILTLIPVMGVLLTTSIIAPFLVRKFSVEFHSLLLYGLGVRKYVIEGEIPPNNSILAFTHHTYFDHIALLSIAGNRSKDLRFVARKTSSPGPLIVISNALKTIMLSDKGRNIVSVVNKIKEEKNTVICVAPAGGSSCVPTEAGNFKTGTVITSIQTERPIYPCVVRYSKSDGTPLIWSKIDNLFTSFYRFIGYRDTILLISISKNPLEVFESDNPEKITENLHKKMQEMLDKTFIKRL